MMSMTKAFIFDMDGVIIASEESWHQYLDGIWSELIGAETAAVFRFPVGMTPNSIYSEAIKHGSKCTEETFYKKFDEIAEKVYKESPFTGGIDELGNFLLSREYKIGLVSSSPKAWIDTVLERLTFGNKISAIVSLNDRPELKPKPHPGGYFETIDQLGATSETTIILEDSNSGIQAAKAAGAFTIGLTAHLLPAYTQHGADIYANNVEDIKQIVLDFDDRLLKGAVS
jgi:beta-phosphoglucomutase-like phosphatase (HAD superfamily)